MRPALLLLLLTGCSILEPGPTCSAVVADTAAVRGDTTIVQHTGLCLGRFR